MHIHKLATSALATLLLAAFIAPAPVSALDMNSWKQEVIQKVSKKQVYPRSALSREIEGRAKVKLLVAASGEIMEHEVVEPTGQELLDREIPKLVKRLNPLPSLPDGQESLSFMLPLSWSLQ